VKYETYKIVVNNPNKISENNIKQEIRKERSYLDINFSSTQVKKEIRHHNNQRFFSLFKPTKDKAFIKELNYHAAIILPNYYISSFGSVCNALKKVNGKAIEEITASMIAENKKSQIYQDYHTTLSKEEAFNSFYDALYSYNGNPNFNQELIPDWLRNISYYHSETGILDVKGDVRAYIYEKDDILTIAFTGTQPATRIESVIADIIQLFDQSYLYALASGLLHLALEKKDYKKVKVIGHSLGGGLCQFSVLTNSDPKVQGICFNSAGLSATTLQYIDENELMNAKQYLHHFITLHDVVSKFGAIVGSVVFLPEVGKALHSLESLKPCLEEYYNIT